MKALVFTDIRKFEIQDIPEPVPAPDEVKLRVHYCGICGSDVHGYMGKNGRRIPPMIMGHELSGEVVECGSNVTDIHLSTRVTAYPLLYCGKCDYCKIGRTNICPNRSFLGVFTKNGAMAEYVCVPAKNIVPIGDAVSFIEGTMIEPLAVALHALKQAGNLEGKNLLIIGAGTIGMLILKQAKLCKAKNIFISDLSESRLARAEKYGAIPVNSVMDDIDTVIKKQTGENGVDITFEAVGIPPTAFQSIAMLKNAGLAIWAGNSASEVQVPMQDVVSREITIRGTHVYTVQDFIEAADSLADGRIEVDSLISIICSLEEAPLYFEQLAGNPGDLIKVVVSCS